jgi:hypothetical protein
MQKSDKREEQRLADAHLLGMLWAMTHPKDRLPSLIEAPASVEITTAHVEFRGLKLSVLEREAELVWEVRIKGRV